MPKQTEIPPSIAYVIPALNEEAMLGATLERLKTLAGPKEIILVDGGSADRTIEIAKRAGAVVSESAPGRGTQMNAGAKLASSPLLCFVHADTLLSHDSAEEIRALLATASNAAGAFRLSFDSKGKRLAFYSFCSRINQTLFTYGDQTLFLRRETFEEIGGFKTYPFLEDIEIQRRLRKIGKFVKSKESVVSSARRFQAKGPFTQQLINIMIVAAYHLGASPKNLERFYTRIR